MNRVQALAEFSRLGKHKDEAISVIVSSSVNEQSVVYRLTLITVLDVLKRYLVDEVAIDELVLWANVIESRSDIDCSAVEGVIYALSNSEQMGDVDKNKIEKLINLLIV